VLSPGSPAAAARTDDLIERRRAVPRDAEPAHRRDGQPRHPGVDVVEQIAQVDSSYMLGATNWVGLGVPFHCSALGKVFLAYGVVDPCPRAASSKGGRRMTHEEILKGCTTRRWSATRRWCSS
jgi:hypothetical protein